MDSSMNPQRRRRTLNPDLESLWCDLLRWLRKTAPLGILFSGGGDSVLLAQAAAEALDCHDYILFFIDSELDPPASRRRATAEAARLGAPLQIIPGIETDHPAVSANLPDRCYHCRKLRHGQVRQHPALPFHWPLADGTHLDDLGERRPGLQASREDQILHPLADTGWTKSAIRQALEALGLEAASVAPSPCLATRIPYGQPVRREDLRRIAQAEALLQGFGFSCNRVRLYTPQAAVLEVSPQDLPQAFALRETLLEEIRPLGFASLALDLEGYFPGKMDRTLSPEPDLFPVVHFREGTPFE